MIHKNHVDEKEAAVENTERVAKDYVYEHPAIQTALFILWRVYNKQCRIGARIFYDELKKAIRASRTAHKEALVFLENTGVAVNEVVVESKTPQSLIQRYGILKDE